MPRHRPSSKPNPADRVATADDAVRYLLTVVAAFNEGMGGIRDKAVKESRQTEPYGPDSDPNTHPSSQAELAGYLARDLPLEGIPESLAVVLAERNMREDGWEVQGNVVRRAIREAQKEGLINTQIETWVEHNVDGSETARTEEALVLPKTLPPGAADIPNPSRATTKTEIADVLEMSTKTLNEAIGKGRIRVCQVTRQRWRVCLDDVPEAARRRLS